MDTSEVMRRHGRAAAVACAVIAVSATAFMTVAATANAATEAGKCADTVNVRSMPDINSKIVALCRTGQAVKVGETKNGFVHLVDLAGWAAQEYVAVNGHTPAAPVDRTAPAASSDPADDSDDAAAAKPSTKPAAKPSTKPATKHAPTAAAKPAPAPQRDDADDSDAKSSNDSDSKDDSKNDGGKDDGGSDDSSGGGRHGLLG